MADAPVIVIKKKKGGHHGGHHGGAWKVAFADFCQKSLLLIYLLEIYGLEQLQLKKFKQMDLLLNVNPFVI